MEITEAELAEQNAIVANATRLIRDAKLLMDHKRHASAYALAVIALEEFGKVILRRWENDRSRPPLTKRRTSHLAKQEAVSSLLLSHYIVSEFDKPIRDFSVDDEALVQQIAEAMCTSKAGQFHHHVNLGAVEKAKHIAFYRDNNPLLEKFKPEEFSGADPTDMFERCRAVADVIWNDKTMQVARALYNSPKHAQG